MANKTYIKGLDKLVKDLKALGDEGVERIAITTESTAKNMALHAANTARKIAFDNGKLAQGIEAFKRSDLHWSVMANSENIAPYSAYVEFGTGGRVSVPKELKDVAIQFIGAGIKEVNLKPRPFLYPALLQGRIDYIKALKQDLKDLTKNI